MARILLIEEDDLSGQPTYLASRHRNSSASAGRDKEPQKRAIAEFGS